MVWNSKINRNASEFSVSPNSVLDRVFVWNQISRLGNQTAPGRYEIDAMIGADESAFTVGDWLFQTYVVIEIAAT